MVDNEEADRGLLRNVLQPLGFEIREAANGYDCLDLLAAGLQPDVVLLDLAMPGMDGWETLRRLRALPGLAPQVAIVSANAFDRGLDQGLGIGAQDFIVKPWRQGELLDWLQQRLGLQWLDTPLAVPDSVPPLPVPAPQALPPRDALQALHALAQLGYFRGLVNKLQALGQSCPDSAPFLAALELQVRNYQFEQVSEQLQEALNASQAG